MESSGRSDRILGKKWFLYLTEFFSGMSVMAVELGASRLLAPYFSSSQIVWTIIIGTIMIAMALGYYFGGKWADKDPDPDRLYKRLLISAVWIAAIPCIGKLVILGVTGLLVVTVDTGFLIWAAFIACSVIFVFPLFLLGTVTPSLAKYTTESLDDNGKTIGTLSAFNTIGSIIGTFTPTFITIPAVGTAVTFLIFSGILLALAQGYFISVKRCKVRIIICSVLFIGMCIASTSFGFAFWDRSVIHETESVYNYIQIKDSDNERALATNVMFGVQSVTPKKSGLTGLYYDAALAAPLMTVNSTKSRALILGMGTGTCAMQYKRYFPDMSVRGVEIDSRITELAHEYFGLSDEIEVTEYDGRAYLEALRAQRKRGNDTRYDVIIVDAFQDITIPFQMSSKEFFTLVKDSLSPDGVMAVNLNLPSDEEGGINDCLRETILSVFSEVYCYDIADSTNLMLFCSNDKNMLTRFELSQRETADSELETLFADISSGLKRCEPKGCRILTDDNAPVELLGMKTIDRMISEELEYYKDIFRREGIGGLLDITGY